MVGVKCVAARGTRKGKGFASKGAKRSAAKTKREKEMEKVKLKIQEAFKEADIDGDGVLDRTQLTFLMRKMKCDIIGEDTDPRPAAIDWVMDIADRSGDGKLSLREVEKAISVYAAYLQEREFIDGIFEKYDKNKDQVLDREELTGYCKELNEGVEPTEAEIDWILSRSDKGGMTSQAGDGLIGRIELLAVVNEWFFMPPDVNDADFDDLDLDDTGSPKSPPSRPQEAFAEDKPADPAKAPKEKKAAPKAAPKKKEAESGCCVVS